jgi:hypothetical protein
MPVIDLGDPSSWPVGWEPEHIRLAREAGRDARRHDFGLNLNPYTAGTLSHSAWASGWTAEARQIWANKRHS